MKKLMFVLAFLLCTVVTHAQVGSTLQTTVIKGTTASTDFNPSSGSGQYFSPASGTGLSPCAATSGNNCGSDTSIGSDLLVTSFTVTISPAVPSGGSFTATIVPDNFVNPTTQAPFQWQYPWGLACVIPVGGTTCTGAIFYPVFVPAGITLQMRNTANGGIDEPGVVETWTITAISTL